jgi:hypothetical protein
MTAANGRDDSSLLELIESLLEQPNQAPQGSIAQAIEVATAPEEEDDSVPEETPTGGSRGTMGVVPPNGVGWGPQQPSPQRIEAEQRLQGFRVWRQRQQRRQRGTP